MQAPSNKVGLILIIVVLFVSGTMVLSKVDLSKKDSEDVQAGSVDIVIERKINQGENDMSWLEEFERTGLSPSIRKSNEFDTEAFTPGTITEQMSIDLFAEYLNLKQKGFLTQEDEDAIVEKIAQQVTSQARFDVNRYVLADFNTTQSTPDTVSVYGDRLAQITLDNFNKMDAVKNLQGITYLRTIASLHNQYVQDLLGITVPDVVQDVHVELVNGVYNTSVLFDVLSSDIQDPVVALTLMTQYQSIQSNDVELYTILAMYFKNNDIIFDTESTIIFWDNFY